MIVTTPLQISRAYRGVSAEIKRKLMPLATNLNIDDPIPFESVLDRLGFEDTLSVLVAIKGHDGAIRLFACWCAKNFLMPKYEKGSTEQKDLLETIKATALYAIGSYSRNWYLTAIGGKDRWSLSVSSTQKAAQLVIKQCLDTIPRETSKKPCPSAGIVVSENDTAAIAFYKRCRLKYYIVSAETSDDTTDATAARKTLIEKMEGEFRILCRLEGRYALRENPIS